MPTLLDEKREGDIRISSRGGNVVIEETWGYIVRADDKRQTRIEIEATAGLPLVNFTLSAGGLAICKTKVCTRREANPEIWDVTCTFSSEVEQSSATTNQLTTDPTTWVVTRKTIFYQKDEWTEVDVSGNAYKNSAGQPFVGIAPRKRTLVGWRFAQFELPSITDEMIADRNEKINGNTFKGKAAKTLLLTVEASQLGYFYGRYLRLTEYLLKYDPKDWRTRKLDVGMVYINAGEWLPFTDKAGNVFEGPLNGAGGKAAPGTGAAVLTFDDYSTSDFSFLRI